MSQPYRTILSAPCGAESKFTATIFDDLRRLIANDNEMVTYMSGTEYLNLIPYRNCASCAGSCSSCSGSCFGVCGGNCTSMCTATCVDCCASTCEHSVSTSVWGR